MFIPLTRDQFAELVIEKFNTYYSKVSTLSAIELALKDIIDENITDAPRKQTSSKLSSLGGKYMNWQAPSPEWEEFAKDVRSMAASIVSQDETEGQ